MNRQQKETVIEQLKNDFTKSKVLFLVGFRGMSVAQMQILRKELREKGALLKVAKIRLIKRAAKDMDNVEPLLPYLKDQLAVVFSAEEPPATAKVLYDFAKDHETLEIVVGSMDSKIMTKDQVESIATLPSREVLISQIIGIMQSPVAQVIRTLNAPMTQIITILQRMSEQKK